MISLPGASRCRSIHGMRSLNIVPWEESTGFGKWSIRRVRQNAPAINLRPRVPAAIYDPTTGANYGAKPNTGNQNADFFLGAAASYSQRRNAPFNICSLLEYDSYVQDNWRVSSRLTLNLGLRWEAHNAPRASNDYMVAFDIKNKALAARV